MFRPISRKPFLFLMQNTISFLKLFFICVLLFAYIIFIAFFLSFQLLIVLGCNSLYY